MSGEVQALFYRYRTVGGFDHVADLLIGPRANGPRMRTRPGDSGTLWFWDEAADGQENPGPPRPLATQWGGHSVLEAGGQGTRQFALASYLATVCRLLEVEVIRDWAIGHGEYWGKVGHFKVGALACHLLTDDRLSKFFFANEDRVSVPDANLQAGNLSGPVPGVVPLADVADLVWRDTRPEDAANHFADMDQEGKGEFAGRTLLQMWKADSATLDPKLWDTFYEALGVAPDKRGALPFRVAQGYALLVEALRAGKVEDFLAVAGLMAHYVGDACQPLHVSLSFVLAG